MVGFRTAENVEEVGVVCTQRGGENALIRADKVLRRQRRAIRPERGRPQMKRVAEAVRRDFPAFRDARHGVQVDRIGFHEALEQGMDDIALRHAGGEVRVELGHLVPDAAVQHLFAVTAFDRGLALGAAGRQQEQKAGQEAEKEDHVREMSATAWAAMANPRPMSSLPSLVVALRPTWLISRPAERASAAFISARRG